MRIIFAVRASVLVAFIVVVVCQEDIDPQRPCEHSNAINLPKDKKCLVPIKSAYTWVAAASNCERSRGILFQPPDTRLASRPELMRCLASMTEARYNDMWINALGVWSPHFKWTNTSAVNQVDFCSSIPPPREDTNNVTSDSLSVDYCVSTCHDRGARYTIYHNNTNTLECYCRHVLDNAFMWKTCDMKSVNTSYLSTYFILQTKPDSLIKINNLNVLSRTEILCSTVDSTTTSTRQITSEKCFNRQHFICDIGDESKCASAQCTGTGCQQFTLRRRCMIRVSIAYNWYAARGYCQTLGGDLWNMYELNDLTQVPIPSAPVARYWIGGTNYDWKFDATSANLGSVPSSDYNRVRCGHMSRETATGTAWQWSDTVCDQQKAFLCQFPKTTFSPEEINNEVTCPWEMFPISPDITNTPSPPTVTAGAINGSTEDSFPYAAVIAAVIAGLILLTCLALTFAYCNKRQWWAGKFKKAREHLTFIPYFADVSGGDYESHANMSSVSDHGSQIGLVKGNYHHGNSGYGMSTSYGEQSGAFSSKSLDRRHKETMDRKLAESQNYLISGNTSLDERGLSATYNTLPNRPRDLMTLQAQMDIKDDVELASLRASVRNRPEVALVTDNVDMNFTVNRAVARSHSHAESELSRSSMERTMEGITLPVSEGGMGLNLPDRVAEEARLYSTMTSNYHGM